MKILERNNFEYYKIHTCEGCGSKLEILREDCKQEWKDTHTLMAFYDYVCKCPVCGEEIRIDGLTWDKRPKAEDK